jgi:hypothetical protein
MIDDHNLYEASLLSDVLILRVIAINNEQFLGAYICIFEYLYVLQCLGYFIVGLFC